MLPAFAVMQEDLGTTMDQVQLIVPIFAIGYAVGQLLFGPLSDRFGRRLAVIIGLLLYLGGAIVAAAAPSIELILAGRVLQGFGAGSGQVVGRAILRDCNAGQALARAMAFAMAIFAVGPIFAPLIGYGLTSLGNWRYVFIAMVLFSMILLAITLFWYRETNSHIDQKALNPGNLWRSFAAIFQNRQSRTFLLLAMASYCALLSFITNAPRVYQTAFGIENLSFAVLFAITGIGIVVGQLVNRLLLVRYGILWIIRAAALVLLVVSTGIAAFSWFDMLTATSFTAMMFLFNTSFLVVISNAASLIIDPHKSNAGMASAVLGFATLTASSIYVTITLPVFSGDILLWSIGMTTLTALTVFPLLLIRKESLSFQGA